ncbi:unnamed protein product, partial [Protopolystoma xenopodis]
GRRHSPRNNSRNTSVASSSAAVSVSVSSSSSTSSPSSTSAMRVGAVAAGPSPSAGQRTSISACQHHHKTSGPKTIGTTVSFGSGSRQLTTIGGKHATLACDAFTPNSATVTMTSDVGRRGPLATSQAVPVEG